jgi:hypothetical protein
MYKIPFFFVDLNINHYFKESIMLEYMLAVTIVTNTLGVLGSVQSILLPNYRL